MYSGFEMIAHGQQEPDRRWMDSCDYRLVRSVEELKAYVAAGSSLACDFETTGLNLYSRQVRIVGFSCSNGTGSARYVPIAHQNGADLNLPLREVLAVLTEWDATHPSLWFNYKYDGHLLALAGVELQRWEDVLIAVWLHRSDEHGIGLKASAKRHLGIEMISFDEVAGAAATFAELHPEEAVNYACADADMTGRLWRHPEIVATLRPQKLTYEIEKNMVPVIWEGTDTGVVIDAARVQEEYDTIGAEVRDAKGRVVTPASGQAAQLMAAIQAEVVSLCTPRVSFDPVAAALVAGGGGFDLNSADQVGKALAACGVPLMQKTATGKASTKKAVLEELGKTYPICSMISQYRELSTQSRNYLAKLLAWTQKHGPLVRFGFNQMGAPTGRMSSGTGGSGEEQGLIDINVQSLPDPDKKPYLPNIRSCVRAALTDDWVIVAIDYSQVELRIAAILSREPAWIKAFNEGADIHLANARLAYNDQTIEKSDPKRKFGKTLAFAILFGAGVKTVAAHGRIVEQQARKLIQAFYGNVPTLRRWIDATHRSIEDRKQTSTWTGRVRNLSYYFRPDAEEWEQAQAKREGLNACVQGGAADAFKVACDRVRKVIRERGWQHVVQQVLWVHDEIVLRVHTSVLEDAVPAIVDKMEFQAKSWPLQLKAEAEVGYNWGELVSWKDWQKGQRPVRKDRQQPVVATKPSVFSPTITVPPVDVPSLQARRAILQRLQTGPATLSELQELTGEPDVRPRIRELRRLGGTYEISGELVTKTQ